MCMALTGQGCCRPKSRLFHANHVRGHVHADDAAGGVAIEADLPGRQETVETGAAAQVQHFLARLEGGDGLGIAAAQARATAP